MLEIIEFTLQSMIVLVFSTVLLLDAILAFHILTPWGWIKEDYIFGYVFISLFLTLFSVIIGFAFLEKAGVQNVFLLTLKK